MPLATVVQNKREDTTVERDMHHEGCCTERLSRPGNAQYAALREYYFGEVGREAMSSPARRMGESRGVVDVTQSSAPSTMSYARGTLPDDIYTAKETQAQNDDMEVSPLTMTSCHEQFPVAPPPLDVSLKPSSLVSDRWSVSDSKPAPQAMAQHQVEQQFAVNNSELQRDKDIEYQVNMTKHIEQILRQKKPHANHAWLIKLPQTAKRLERILFSEASSLEVYRDISTLEQRLRQLALNKIKAQRMEQAQLLRFQQAQMKANLVQCVMNLPPGHRIVPSQVSRVVDHTYHDYTNYSVQYPVSKMFFPKKLHEILTNAEFEQIISWMPHGRAWKLHNRDLFQTEVAPKYFHQQKFASFTRQLTGWGFKRLTKQGPDFNAYYHQCFLRERPDLVVLIKRVPNNLGRLTPDVINEPNFYDANPAWRSIKKEDDMMRSDSSEESSGYEYVTSLDDAAATALISLSSVRNESLLPHELKVFSKRPVLPLRKRREQLAHDLIQQQDHPQQTQYQLDLLLPQKEVTNAAATRSMVPKVNHTAEVDHYSNAISTARTPPAMLPKVMKTTGKYKIKLPKVMKTTGKYKIKLPKVMRTTGKHSDTDTETERTGRWTEVEHDAFLEGLEIYGKNWNEISRHIKTRSVVQARTHAQKYYLKLYKDKFYVNHFDNVSDKKSTENELLTTCISKEHDVRPQVVETKTELAGWSDKPQKILPNVRAQVSDNYYHYHKCLRKGGDDIAHQPDAEVQELDSLPTDKEHDVHSETTVELAGRMMNDKSQTIFPKVVTTINNDKWSAIEHAAFLSGYAMYGKDWKKISAWMKTRTVAQTRMHGQSYFKRIREGGNYLRFHAPVAHHPEAGVEELDCRKKGGILFTNVDYHDKSQRIFAGPMLQSSLPRSNSSDAVSCLLKMSNDATAISTCSTTICRMSMASTSESSSQNESSATPHQYPTSCHDSSRRVFIATTDQTERLTKRMHEQPEFPKVKNISDRLLDTYNDSTYVGKWTAEEHAAFLSGLSMYGEDWSKVAGWVKTRSVIQTMAHAENYFQSLPKEVPINTHTGEWSTIENDAFMTGLESYGRDWIRIAAMIKTRTVVQTTAHAQNYFQQLMKEVNKNPIIACASPFNVIARASPPNVIARTSKWIQDTENLGRWNKIEHDAFLLGFELYGKNWKQVAAHVKTRTVVQTRTHAQKYFAMKHQKAGYISG